MKGYVHEDDFFIVHDALVLMTLKETTTWMKDNNYFHSCLLTVNVLQDRTPYDGHPVGNIPKFMPLDSIRNIDILHSFRFHCVLSRFVIDREGIYEEESNMRFSFYTPKKINRGMKLIQESKMGKPSTARIILDLDLALKALEIVYRINGAAVEGPSDRNGHTRKLLGEGESLSWGGAQTKVKGRKCELTKHMVLYSDILKLCLKKNTTSLTSSLTPLFYD